MMMCYTEVTSTDHLHHPLPLVCPHYISHWRRRHALEINDSLRQKPSSFSLSFTSMCFACLSVSLWSICGGMLLFTSTLSPWKSMASVLPFHTGVSDLLVK